MGAGLLLQGCNIIQSLIDERQPNRKLDVIVGESSLVALSRTISAQLGRNGS